MFIYVQTIAGTKQSRISLQSGSDTPVTIYEAGTATNSAPVQTGGSEAVPVFIPYRGRIYILNGFSQNLVLTEFQSVHEMSIPAPATAPTLAASGTGITGSAIGYLTYVHKIGDRAIHESAVSAPSATVALSNQGRSWTNLPTTAPSRVTHIRGYVSMDGTDPRFAWERQLGATSVTESVATLSLGQVAPVGGVPPIGLIGTIYNHRLWTVDTQNQARLYYSELFRPEAVQPTNYLTMPDNTKITGLVSYRDILLVFTLRSTYAVTGWSELDFVLRQVHPTIGCVSHWSIHPVYNRIWFASLDGVYAFNGSMTYLMKDLYNYWRDDYATKPSDYKISQAVVDPFYRTYQLWIPRAAGGSFAYIGHFEDAENDVQGGFTQPKWTFDVLNRTLSSVAAVIDPADLAGKVLIYGGYTNAKAYQHEIATDTNDASDTYNKALTLRFRHQLMSDPGGDIMEGKRFDRIWSHVQSENNAWTIKFYGGDEYAGDATTPQASDTVAASASAGKLVRTVHHHRPVKVSGRGLTVTIAASSPKDMRIRGFGGTYGMGTTYRGSTS